eukprot:13371411-Alexandrium_andersonii.AAC.1
MGRSRARPLEPVLTGLLPRWRRSRWYGHGRRLRRSAICACVRSPTAVLEFNATCAVPKWRLE